MSETSERAALLDDVAGDVTVVVDDGDRARECASVDVVGIVFSNSNCSRARSSPSPAPARSFRSRARQTHDSVFLSRIFHRLAQRSSRGRVDGRR